MKSEGGVEDKWVNQTNHRKSGPNLGSFTLLLVQSRSPMPTASAAFTTALKRAEAKLLNMKHFT